ncbi:two-component sensor histidine kinase [Neobacillus sp. MM2021_6]|uniref:ATP-binding protein n=1 Tax=Bacillaceae TaxID=186817 RepID=UPI00140BDF9C|nr:MULTISPECIES: ATP-binding protein [Bacillaceae]MBO0960378.1 two-component sensor histidine kinase [Neobacillus sp. MM2021_6]NHC16765.1 two-component sensor histidine kinase [Bacillus sp. MM2020_4]
MKSRKGNFFIYFIVVILPVIILGTYYFFDILKENDLERKKDALWVASIYQKNWDQFISETTTSLDILSLSAMENIDSPKKMEPLLMKVNQNDPRYGGLYLLNENGNLLTGSVPLRNEDDFSKLPFIKEVINTKDTIISEHEEILKNNQRIVGIARPVLDENGELKAILIADLRIDYMRNLMKVLTPETKLYVVNGGKSAILEMNVTNNEIDEHNTHWVTSQMDRIPWSIKVKIAERNNKQIGKTLGKVLFIILVITHILYLLIEYLLLRRFSYKERRQNELQKLELVGTLAASTAHEIRNPLTGVKGLIQLLGEKYTDQEDRFYFDVINSELKRINEIVSEFLILGKPTAQVTNNINIAETLKELKPLIISEGNSQNVECNFQLSSEPIIVTCVKDELKQVILNLTKNAFESFEKPGILEIKLLHHDKDFCKLEISDNGKGIPKDELGNIFVPFYTSKETGTGLGLVICKRIINSFGGSILIESKEKMGTTVSITLPIVK